MAYFCKASTQHYIQSMNVVRGAMRKKKQRMNEGGKHSSAFMCQVVLLLRQVTDGLLCRKTDEGSLYNIDI